MYRKKKEINFWQKETRALSLSFLEMWKRHSKEAQANRIKKRHKGILLVLFPCLVVLLLCGMGVSMYILFQKARKKRAQAIEKAQSEEVCSIWGHDGKIMFENIIEATNNFNDKYLIGVRGQGINQSY